MHFDCFFFYGEAEVLKRIYNVGLAYTSVTVKKYFHIVKSPCFALKILTYVQVNIYNFIYRLTCQLIIFYQNRIEVATLRRRGGVKYYAGLFCIMCAAVMQTVRAGPLGNEVLYVKRGA